MAQKPTHDAYIKVEAGCYYDLGYQLGEQFAETIQYSVADMYRSYKEWPRLVELAKRWLPPTVDSLPQYVDEMRGYASGAQVPFADLWALSLEDELWAEAEHCTTVVTNNGSLVGHNEDWDEESEEMLYVVHKTLNGKSILELFYAGTLGGNSISINSDGCVHAVNTLLHTDHQIGVPRNIIGRWLQESANPQASLKALARIKRSAGYHHLFVGDDITSVECSAKKSETLLAEHGVLSHTNHFQSSLDRYEDNDDSEGSYQRLKRVKQLLNPQMTVASLKDVMRNDADGAQKGVFNRRTIGQVIIDREQKRFDVWLKRESNRGFVSYDCP